MQGPWTLQEGTFGVSRDDYPVCTVAVDTTTYDREPTETTMASAQTPSSVVVGTDGSTAALDAVRWAVREASARRVPLRIVHVAPRHDPDPVFGAPDVDRDYGNAALLAAAAAAAEEPNSPVVEPVYRQGTPESVLRHEAVSASLLVVGSVGIGMLGSLVLGSTAAELAATAPCPVAIIKSYRTAVSTDEHNALPVVAVLAGTDDVWEEWDSIVAAATAEARIRRTSMIIASSDEAGDTDGGLERRITRWQAQTPDVRIDSISQDGALATLAVSLSKAAQLTVVGPPEHDRLPLLGITGRTVHQLLFHSDSPLMICRSHPVGPGPAASTARSTAGVTAAHQ